MTQNAHSADGRPAVPRQVVQPGPAAADRWQCVAGNLVEVDAVIEPGSTICDGVARALQPSALTAAAVRFTDLALHPMRYVQPAYSSSPERVAYYSDVREPEAPHTITVATATYGSKDNEPFLHCHALWRDEDGVLQGGHVLPFDAVVARPTPITAFGTRDAAMVVAPDPETNFSVFGVVRAPMAASAIAGRKLVVAKIRPNEDLVTAIEAICREQNISNAVVRSGIGSTAGGQFEGQPLIEEVPTELLVLEGHVAPGEDGAPRLDMDTALIDAQGMIHTGVLERGQNPVLICFELFLEVVGP